MKTDRILKLIQQKNVMRSGGALPLPKHQSRGQVAPYITSDPKEFAYREDLRRDSLDLYNRQNLYNAQFLANFPNAPVIPNDRVDFRDLVNLVRQQDKKSVEKNVTGLVDILKEHIEPSKTYSRHYPSDPRYKAHVRRTEGPLLKPGHYVPNSVANRRGVLDSLGVFDDDTKSAPHSYDERIDDPFARTWIRSGSVIQNWKNPLFDDEHTSEVFGVPYRVVHHPYIKPIGNLLYHQRIPFSTGSSTAAGIFDPSSAMYDDASALNVSLPYYKKPVQEVIFKPKLNVTTPIQKPKPTRPAKLELMPMRGMPSTDVEAVPQKVAVPPTPALRPGFMDMRGEWSDVLPTAYPYAQTPEMLEKMGYRGSKKEGGLAKAQKGLPKNNPYLPNTPLATGAAESVMGPIDYLLLPSQLPIKAASALGRGAITLAEILNPLGGFRPSTDMLYRGIGKEGFEDAMESGVLRAAQHDYPAKRSIAEIVNSPKQFDKVYYSPDAEAAMRYGQGYVAAVPKTAADFVNRYKGKGKDWSQFTSREIPISEATFYQKYPLVGYKKKLRFQDAGESGLQYVPNGTYGRYYDPETKEYIPEVYLPDVEISANRSIPFQNNQFAPHLVATGMVENSVLDDPLTMAVMATALPVTAPMSLGKRFAGNLASEATMGLSDLPGLASAGKKSLEDITSDLNNLTIKPRSEATTDDLQDLLNKLRSIREDLEKHVPSDVVPEEHLQEAKRIITKEPTLKKSDFWTDSELNELINRRRKFNDEYNTLNDEMVEQFITIDPEGKRSRNELLDLFPNLKTKWDDYLTRKRKTPDFLDKHLTSKQKALIKGYKYPSSDFPAFYGEVDVRNILSPHFLNLYATNTPKPPLEDWAKEFMKEIESWAPYKRTVDDRFVIGPIREELGKTLEGYSPIKPGSTPLFKFEPGKMNKLGGLTSSKAREILHDKSVHGHPLTDKQRRFFGAIASGKKIRIKKNR